MSRLSHSSVTNASHPPTLTGPIDAITTPAPTALPVGDPHLRVTRSDQYGSRLITTAPIAAGQVITSLAGFRRTNHPTRLSIQIGIETHVDDIGIFSYLNHSCAPTTIVDAERLELRAAHDLAEGDELTFFYPSTEWDMAEPFSCLCGASTCLGIVAGAKHLPLATLDRYYVNPHIRALLAATR